MHILLFVVSAKVSEDVYKRQFYRSSLMHSHQQNITLPCQRSPIKEGDVYKRQGFGEAVGFVLLCFRNVVFRHEVAAASVDVVDAEAGFKVKPVQDIPVQEGAAHDTFFPVVIVCIMECGDGIGRRGAFGIHKTPVFIVGTLHGTDGIGLSLIHISPSEQ